MNIDIAKPIIFDTEEVKAILDGRKTQFRNIIKLPHNNFRFDCFNDEFDDFSEAIFYDKDIDDYLTIKNKIDIGDILYVKETWTFGKVVGDTDGYGDDEYWLEQTQCEIDNKNVFYKADMEKAITDGVCFEEVFWKPSVHIPKKYARIFLRVTNVRVERLYDITQKDIYYEGIEQKTYMVDHVDDHDYRSDLKDYAYQEFMKLWNKRAKDGYKWKDNPYVFTYDFEVIKEEKVNEY